MYSYVFFLGTFLEKREMLFDNPELLIFQWKCNQNRFICSGDKEKDRQIYILKLFVYVLVFYMHLKKNGIQMEVKSIILYSNCHFIRHLIILSKHSKQLHLLFKYMRSLNIPVQHFIYLLKIRTF